MNNLIWTDVLKIIANTTAVAGRDFHLQIDSFTEDVMILRSLIDPNIIMTGTMLGDWYRLNFSEMRVAI